MDKYTDVSVKERNVVRRRPLAVRLSNFEIAFYAKVIVSC